MGMSDMVGRQQLSQAEAERALLRPDLERQQQQRLELHRQEEEQKRATATDVTPWWASLLHRWHRS